MQTLEFFFDIASPYAYLGSTQVDALGERVGVDVVWRPFLLGGVFVATGNQPPANLRAKARWMLEDLKDWAAHYEVPFAFNPAFPPNSLHVQRALVVTQDDHGHDAMRTLAQALYRGYWAESRDVMDEAGFVATAKSVGIDGEAIWARGSTPEVKEKLRAITDEAVNRGAFGAPTFFVGDRMWWGNDRLVLVERFLQREA